VAELRAMSRWSGRVLVMDAERTGTWRADEWAGALGYDARYIASQPCGIGQMCLELLHGLAELVDCPRLLVLVNRQTRLPDELWEHEKLVFCEAPGNPRGLGSQLLLPGLLKRRQVRVFHSVDCFNPVAVRGITLLVNIHDLIPLACRQQLTQSKKVRILPLWKSWLRWQCACAAKIVTVSRHSASDLVRRLHLDPAKIEVIYNPIREWQTVEPVGDFRRQFGLHGRIISYVGRQEPYKNVAALVRAVASVRQQMPGENLQLVIAGNFDARYPQTWDEVVRLSLQKHVVFTGYLAEASLGALYQASDVFVFPSLYEGFGMPPLEAMRFGAPVVAGNRTAPPEVLGDAALLVDPADPSAIAAAVLAVLKDSELATRLRQAGVQQVARYSRRRAAEQYLRLYQELLTQSTPMGRSRLKYYRALAG